MSNIKCIRFYEGMYGTPEEREARRLRTLERIRAQAIHEFVAGALA